MPTKPEISTRKVLFNGITFLFLVLNLYFRYPVFYQYSLVTKAVGLLVVCSCLLVLVRHRYLPHLLFAFGASFFLYGFHSNTIYNLTFEFILCLITITILVLNMRGPTVSPAKSPLPFLLASYLLLATFSLFAIPSINISHQLDLFGLNNFIINIFLASAHHYQYSIVGVIRLLIFVIFIQQLRYQPDSNNIYKKLFFGIFIGSALAIIIGLLDYYSVVSLEGFRQLDKMVNPDNIQSRLQSTFGHPGWFAEFVTITIPIILLGFFTKDKSRLLTVSLFSLLLLCEIALILAKARAGWISYPLTLFFCWLFFYTARDNRDLSWQKNKRIILKVLISIPLTILISFLIIYQVIGDSSKLFEEKNRSSYHVKSNSLEVRLSRLFRVEDRLYLWKDGIHAGLESPVWGIGYESFYWQAKNLKSIKESDFNKNRYKRTIYATPHNLYVQIFVSNGVIGLLLWLLIIGTMLTILTRDYITRKDPFNIIIILSTISFHIYGVFQSLQYIPVIWFLIFLNMGYTMSLPARIKTATEKQKNIQSTVRTIGIITILSGVLFYLTNAGSSNILAKYDLEYFPNRPQDFGVYERESWPWNSYRWTGKKATIKLEKTGRIKLTMHCMTPRIAESPVIVTISTREGEIGEVTFTEGISITREYHIRSVDKPILEIEVSRTFNPAQEKMSNDNRDLGILISEIDYLPPL